MKVFSDEFVNWIRRNTICRLFGHKKSPWMEEYSLLTLKPMSRDTVKICLWCGKELERKQKEDCIWKSKILFDV